MKGINKRIMETVNKFYGLNDRYLKYVSDGLLELENDKLVLNGLNRELVSTVYEFVKLNHKKEIIMTEGKNKRALWFHLHFDTENEMLIYSILTKNLINYIHKKLKCSSFSVNECCDNGESEYSDYTIMINFNFK